MATTSIEWCDRVWNVVRGCSRVSPGCGGAAGEGGCYAERQAYRFSGPGMPYEGLVRLGKQGPRWTGIARFVPEKLAEPLSWRKPQRVFVNSMSDLFHEDVTNEQIAAVFGVMAAAPQHTFQILTKRPARMLAWFAQLPMDPRWEIAGAADAVTGGAVCFATKLSWPLPNVWLGVSVEDQPRADERIPLLLETPAAVRFVSAEPLLGPVDLNRVTLDGPHRSTISALGEPPWSAWHRRSIDWVIVGGESGPGARGFDVRWGHDLVRQCAAAKVACFMKQLGAKPFESVSERTSGMGGIGLDLKSRKGGDPAEWPEDLRVRQFPEARP